MKKITSLLTLLLLMVSGVMFAQETTAPTDVTDLSQISNDKTYTLVAKRGFIGVKESKAIFGYEGQPSPSTRQDDLFAILQKDGEYYLFNVGQKKFVNVATVTAGGLNTMSLKDTPDYNFTFNKTEGAEYPWSIRVPKQNNWLMNMGGSRQIAVDSWSTLDDGNQYKITQIGELDQTTRDEALAKLEHNYVADINNAFDNTKLNASADASFVGYITDEQKATIQAAKEEALKTATKQSYETFLQTIKNNSVGFDENAYYLIEHQNTGTKKYPSTQNMHMGKTGDQLPFQQAYDDRVIRRVTENDPLLPRLWKISKLDDGKYGITNANTNCKWANYKGNGNVDMPANPSNQDFGHCVIENIPATNDGFNTMFYIKINGSTINAYSGDGDNVLAAYNNATDRGGFWSFKKVTEIPVAIGAAGWASICMPFPVAIPAGVTAYVAESAKDNVITLKEVSGTVPAKTAMIITGTANSEAKFTIAQATAATEVGENLFSGTTTERIDFSADETFALGAADNGAAFKKNYVKKTFTYNTDQTHETYFVPANKAYILSSNLSAAAQGAALLSLDLGGATTGIEGVQAEDNKEVIYFDLNGRRVMNPAHGVFVTNTGKKVFIR